MEKFTSIRKIKADTLEKLVHHLEVMRISDYLQKLEHPKRLIFLNFVAGVSRGLGIAVGATLIFGVVLEIMRRLILLHIPGIGSFIAEIVQIVESKSGNF